MTVVIFFACGSTGKILAAKGITLKPVKLPVEHGKLVVAETSEGEIKVDIDKQIHTTTLTVAAKKNPDPMLAKLNIRIPVGVRLFQVVPPTKGFDNEFFHETGHGYNTLAYHLVPGADKGQTVQEVILLTSHVPPRLDPATLTAQDFDKDFKKLTADELKKRLTQDE
jgi:hypothetical protein